MLCRGGASYFVCERIFLGVLRIVSRVARTRNVSLGDEERRLAHRGDGKWFILIWHVYIIHQLIDFLIPLSACLVQIRDKWSLPRMFNISKLNHTQRLGLTLTVGDLSLDTLFLTALIRRVPFLQSGGVWNLLHVFLALFAASRPLVVCQHI